MNPLPPEVARRLAALAGAALVLLYEPRGRRRVVLSFRAARDVPLSITIDGVREIAWSLSPLPTLRVVWQMASPVRIVQLAEVRSFEPGGSTKLVRVEVELDGAPPIAVEGEGMMLGPVVVQPAPKAAEPRYWS